MKGWVRPPLTEEWRGGPGGVVAWWPWQNPAWGRSAGHAPYSIGVGKPAGLRAGMQAAPAAGSACCSLCPVNQDAVSEVPDAGPEPADAARATISPLFLVARYPEAVAAFPTPTGRMWDFSWLRSRGRLRNAATRSSAGWASDSAAGDGQGTEQAGSPLSVCAAAQAAAPLQTLILLFSTLLLVLPHER